MNATNMIVNKKGFTLIELLVVIVIIGILATLATVGLNSVRAKARDAKRISDIRQVQSALELYLNENNSYPTTGQVQPGMPLTSPDGSKTYMSKVPGNPKPWAEGSCSSTGAEYSYVSNYNNTYQISYCLANSVNEINSGACTAIPGSICNRCIANCAGKYCGDSDGCSGKCTGLPGANFICNGSFQLYCGTTLITNPLKVNQCSGNTATCSGATCGGAQVCLSGVCKTACTTNADCGADVCYNGGCCTKTTQASACANKCNDVTVSDNCGGTYTCTGTTYCSYGYAGYNCCKGDNTCGVTWESTAYYASGANLSSVCGGGTINLSWYPNCCCAEGAKSRSFTPTAGCIECQYDMSRLENDCGQAGREMYYIRCRKSTSCYTP